MISKSQIITQKGSLSQQNSSRERPVFSGEYYNFPQSPTPSSPRNPGFSYTHVFPSKNADRKRVEKEKSDDYESTSQAHSFRSIQTTLNGIYDKVRSEIKQSSPNGSKIMQNLESHEKRKKIKGEELKQSLKTKIPIDKVSARNTCPDLIQKFEIPKIRHKNVREYRPRVDQIDTNHKKTSFTIEHRSPQYDQRRTKNYFQVPTTPDPHINKTEKHSGPYLFPDTFEMKELAFRSEEKKNLFLEKLKKINSENPQSPRQQKKDGYASKEHSPSSNEKNEKQPIVSEFSTIQNSTASQQQPSLITKRTKFCQTIHKNRLPKCQFSRQSFKTLKTLGKGKFGDVFLALHKESGLIVALKKISKYKVKKFNMVKQVRDEINIHANLNHPNIVKLYGVFEQEDSLYLIMECVLGGTLFDELNAKEKLNIRETKRFMEGVIEAIHYMHDKSIAHRDIKPENILIADSGVAKICDMGWSAVMTTSRKTYCGTFDYVAPEILQRKDYGLSVDIWCLGILAYELLSGKMPYQGDKRTVICKKITNAELEFPKDFPQDAKDFILWLVRKDPEKRPKCRQLLAHPFFRGSKTITGN